MTSAMMPPVVELAFNIYPLPAPPVIFKPSTSAASDHVQYFVMPSPVLAETLASSRSAIPFKGRLLSSALFDSFNVGLIGFINLLMATMNGVWFRLKL